MHNICWKFNKVQIQENHPVNSNVLTNWKWIPQNIISEELEILMTFTEVLNWFYDGAENVGLNMSAF